MENIKIKIVSENYVPPIRATANAAALDLHSPHKIILAPGKSHMIPLGFCMEIPPQYFMQLVTRSSLAVRGVMTLGGIIDSDYRGQVLLLLHNLSPLPIKIEIGDRIGQGIIMKYYKLNLVHVSELNPTERGLLGFGSTGK